MIYNLKVNCEKMIFSWDCDGERQFTIQMAKDPHFQNTVMYQDTHNQYCTYDGFPLKKGERYYFRIRSGVKEWAEHEFVMK